MATLVRIDSPLQLSCKHRSPAAGGRVSPALPIEERRLRHFDGTQSYVPASGRGDKDVSVTSVRSSAEPVLPVQDAAEHFDYRRRVATAVTQGTLPSCNMQLSERGIERGTWHLMLTSTDDAVRRRSERKSSGYKSVHLATK
jgi:hypothetical protein